MNEQDETLVRKAVVFVWDNAYFLKIGLCLASAVMGAMLSLAQYQFCNYGMSLILTVLSLISVAVFFHESFKIIQQH